MYYHDSQAHRMIVAGCLEPVDLFTDAYHAPIPPEILQEAEDKYSQYLAEQERLRQEQEKQQWRRSHTLELFLETPVGCDYHPSGRITSQELYEHYRNWCQQEQLPCHPPRAFFLYVKKHAPHYCLVYSGNIPDRDGKRCRGFYGIRPLLSGEQLNR